MLAKNARIIVLVIDRLGASWLGPYGNTWIETPCFNQFAAQSMLAENMLADSNDLATLYRSYWQGLPAHVLGPDSSWPSLPQIARTAGLTCSLVTDDESLLSFSNANEFEEQVLVRVPPTKRPAKSLEKMRLADVLQAAAEQLAAHSAQFLWIHASAMNSAWDAPPELAESFMAEDDPPPPKLWLPPQKQLAQDFDPDELLGYVHAYAGQLLALDAGLGSLLDQIDATGDADQTWVFVTSPRGYPLGERGVIGAAGDCLRCESLQTPWIARYPRGVGRFIRTQGLLQPVDMFATLADVCGMTIPHGSRLHALAEDAEPTPQIAIARNSTERAMRTVAWYYRERMQDGELRSELFAKPDDHWEVNEVSNRAVEVSRECQAFLAQVFAPTAFSDRRLWEVPEILRRTH